MRQDFKSTEEYINYLNFMETFNEMIENKYFVE
jgi:hypothetical protein